MLLRNILSHAACLNLSKRGRLRKERPVMIHWWSSWLRLRRRVRATLRCPLLLLIIKWHTPNDLAACYPSLLNIFRGVTPIGKKYTLTFICMYLVCRFVHNQLRWYMIRTACQTCLSTTTSPKQTSESSANDESSPETRVRTCVTSRAAATCYCVTHNPPPPLPPSTKTCITNPTAWISVKRRQINDITNGSSIYPSIASSQPPALRRG